MQRRGGIEFRFIGAVVDEAQFFVGNAAVTVKLVGIGTASDEYRFHPGGRRIDPAWRRGFEMIGPGDHSNADRHICQPRGQAPDYHRDEKVRLDDVEAFFRQNAFERKNGGQHSIRAQQIVTSKVEGDDPDAVCLQAAAKISVACGDDRGDIPAMAVA